MVFPFKWQETNNRNPGRKPLFFKRDPAGGDDEERIDPRPEK
jgi:hypothetical protein